MPEKQPELNDPRAFFQSLPKVELHRHLEGSLRLETMLEVAQAHGLGFQEASHLRSLVQVHEEDPNTFQNFLSKFETLRLFYRSPEVIQRITREAIQDAAADQVRYLELRFTPKALSVSQGYGLGEVMDWVAQAAYEASAQAGILTRLIASVNRHESVEIAEQVIQLSVDRMAKGIVALDLAGNEAQFSALPFKSVFEEARRAGLHVTIHAGEWGSATNVKDAILHLGAERIGHGVRVLEDPETVWLAAERGIPFEVCVTSNYQSGVVPSLKEHPLPRMLASRLNVTLNTDDPGISVIRLSDEYRKAHEDLNISLGVVYARVLAAAQAAFLPEAERLSLTTQIAAEFPPL